MEVLREERWIALNRHESELRTIFTPEAGPSLCFAKSQAIPSRGVFFRIFLNIEPFILYLCYVC